MLFVKRDWETELNESLKEDTDVSKLEIIDYKYTNFYDYKNVLDVINQFFAEAIKNLLNKNLLKAFDNIVENLNNLSHFYVDYRKYSNDSDYVNEIAKRLDTFSYKPLSNFNLDNNFKFYKLKVISKEEIEEYKKIKSFKEYKGFHIYIPKEIDEDDSVTIVSTDTEVGIYSLINKNNKKCYLNEYVELIKKVGFIDKDIRIFEKYYPISITETGFLRDITFLINHLIGTLIYLFNSSSYRDDEFYEFDKTEVFTRLFDLTEEIENIKKYVDSRLNS